MYRRLTPFFAPDENGGALPTDYASESWGDVFRNANPSIDEQPEEDSEDTEEETDEQETVETEESDEEVNEDQPDKESETEALAFDDETEIELGEGKQPVKLAELKAGYLRTSDYTKKTQELATQRKDVETMQQELEPTKQWLDYITANPWLFQQIDAAISEFNQSGALPLEDALADQQYGKYINHLMAENTKLQKDLDRVNGEYEGVKLTSELTSLKNDLKAEYGDLVTDDYMQTLQERGKTEKLSSTTLKEIADGYLAKEKLKQTNVSSKKAAAKAVQSVAETRNRAPQAPRSAGQKPANQEPDVSGMSWFDALKQSVKR